MILAWLGMAALLSSCSGYQLLYNQADRLLQDRIEDYVDLGSGQRNRLAQQLDRLHEQHRRLQLPRYRQWLIEVRQAVATQDLSAGQVERWYSLLETEWRALRLQAWPEMAAFFEGLSNGQRRQLVRSLRMRLKDKRLAHQARSEQQRIEYRYQRAQKQFERWLDELSAEQLQQLRLMLEQQSGVRSDWLEYRSRWLEAFERALLARDQRRLEQLVVEPQLLRLPEQRQLLDDNRRAWVGFVATLVKGLTEAQRGHLLARLDRLIEDIEELTAP